MARMFNVREGFTVQDDVLPDRFFQPMEGGTLKGKNIDKEQFLRTTETYYEMMGWDPETGIPRRGNSPSWISTGCPHKGNVNSSFKPKQCSTA